MSLRNRARHLQRATGWSYQQALDRLHALGAAPAELKRRTGWSLERCDRELAAPRPTVPAELAAPRQPIPVAELPPAPVSPLELSCDRLRVLANVLTVVLTDRRGRQLASAGPFDARLLVWTLPHPAVPELLERVASRGLEALELDDSRHLHFAAVGERAVLVIVYDDATSLGLIRLRLREAIPELERLLREAVPVPPRSGGGSGGGPAEMTETVAALRKRFR